jgi:hypothetical protein
VLEILGLQVDSLADSANGAGFLADGWNPEERALLQAKVEAREPFLDFTFGRIQSDGSTQQFRVSGQPMFNNLCQLIGYRGIGVEIFSKV